MFQLITYFHNLYSLEFSAWYGGGIWDYVRDTGKTISANMLSPYIVNFCLVVLKEMSKLLNLDIGNGNLFTDEDFERTYGVPKYSLLFSGEPVCRKFKFVPDNYGKGKYPKKNAKDYKEKVEDYAKANVEDYENLVIYLKTMPVA